MELVRNAYDADATTCTIELLDTDDAGGTLRVVDNGIGMTRRAILNGWLVLGRSGKNTHKRTKLGRIPVGEKGLGRLAALRMGATAELVTRPKSERSKQHRVVFDWQKFESASIVEDVAIPVTTRRSARGARHGTVIEISNLRFRFRRTEVTRLARALLLLSDPFKHSSSFTPVLVAPEFADIERRVRQSYFDQADFILRARLNARGRASAEVKDRNGRVLYRAPSAVLEGEEGPFQSAPAQFELWVFLLGGERYTPRPVTVAEIRSWLKVVGGVHLYQRGLRVHPYGDPGHDWLEMNLARTRSPEERPSTNTSIGRVVVDDRDHELVQKTDRSGFIENDAYRELKRFAQSALEWMARERLRTAEIRRERERKKAPRDVAAAKEALDLAIEELPSDSQAPIVAAVGNLVTATARQQSLLEEELRLYRTLATVGTTSAVFAHEVTKPVRQIERAANIVQRRVNRLSIGIRDLESIEGPLALVIRSANALRSFARVPLTLMQRRKRKSGYAHIHEAISEVADLLQPFFTESHIAIGLDFADEAIIVPGSVAEVQAVAANVFTNSINAFNAQPIDRQRQIRVTTSITEQKAVLSFADSGSGIQGISLDDIWLPGQSTFQAGSGLGLTIVRDVIADLGGAIQAIPNGDLGGAEFVVELPLAEAIDE